MKINLGAGNDIQEGWVNHDIKAHREEIKVIFDLNNFPYPIEDEYYDEVRAWDVIEHLDEPLKVMDEIHRILKPNGIFTAKACGWENPNYWVDITHKHGFDIKSFDYLVSDTEIGRIYNYYTNKKWKYLEDYPKYDRRKNILVKMTSIKEQNAA